MFSQTIEYALRVIVCLAAAGNEPLTIPQLAKATKTPEGYLAKVLRSLARGQLIRTRRGLGGGSVLARPPEQISVLDVIQCVDPIKRLVSCPLELKSHGTNLCPLHRRMDNAIAMVEQAFRDSTIAELIAEPTSSKPMVDNAEALRDRAFPARLTIHGAPPKKSPNA
jgi:Rrf2 family nitric oxide-sensitive transcriptional repressor